MFLFFFVRFKAWVQCHLLCLHFPKLFRTYKKRKKTEKTENLWNLNNFFSSSVQCHVTTTSCEPSAQYWTSGSRRVVFIWPKRHVVVDCGMSVKINFWLKLIFVFFFFLATKITAITSDSDSQRSNTSKGFYSVKTHTYISFILPFLNKKNCEKERLLMTTGAVKTRCDSKRWCKAA